MTSTGTGDSPAESREKPARCSKVRTATRWLGFRVGALLLGCLPLLMTELFCRMAGWGQVDFSVDPFVGFASLQPLFQRSADGLIYQTSQTRLGFFRSDSFAAQKPADEFRIFVFGGSTVQGNPFSIETSFPEFLRLTLQSMDPTRRWEVVNCGGVSYATYRLLPVMEECLQYQPDLFIFCEGQNEFLEDVTYADSRRLSPIVAPMVSAAGHLQVVRAIVNACVPAPESGVPMKDRPTLSTEVRTLLDQSGGLEHFQRDDGHAKQVVCHFQYNLERMIGLCRHEDVPLLLIQPPVNLCDCPPFKSAFAAETPPDVQQRTLQSLQQASALSASQPQQALTMLQKVVSEEPRFAMGWYELGQLQLTLGDHQAALQSLQRAVDEDICPLRMTTPLRRAMQQVVSRLQVPFLNAHDLLAQRCIGGIVGEQVLVDHVHPSFRGHEDIAIAIAAWMAREGFVHSQTSDWQEPARKICRDTVQSLDDSYFLRGRRALRALQQWAAGRALEPDLAEPEPASANDKDVPR